MTSMFRIVRRRERAVSLLCIGGETQKKLYKRTTPFPCDDHQGRDVVRGAVCVRTTRDRRRSAGNRVGEARVIRQLQRLVGRLHECNPSPSQPLGKRIRFHGSPGIQVSWSSAIRDEGDQGIRPGTCILVRSSCHSAPVHAHSQIGSSPLAKVQLVKPTGKTPHASSSTVSSSKTLHTGRTYVMP